MGKVVRPAAVAGLFYPAQPRALEAAVHSYLRQGRERLRAAGAAAPPLAVIAPHAGYVYSGPVAGTAFAAARRAPTAPRRVVVMGPAHTLYFRGLALPGAAAMATPLGDVPVDAEGAERAREAGPVTELPAAHAREHCLEVELPFLLSVFGEVPVVPLVIGDATAEQAAGVLDALWDEETFVVVSSDLSHYLPYEAARRRDRATADAIEHLQPERLDRDCACGRLAVQALLEVARTRGYRARCVDLRNSGDTAGPPERVVGYGAFTIEADRAA